MHRCEAAFAGAACWCAAQLVRDCEAAVGCASCWFNHACRHWQTWSGAPLVRPHAAGAALQQRCLWHGWLAMNSFEQSVSSCWACRASQMPAQRAAAFGVHRSAEALLVNACPSPLSAGKSITKESADAQHGAWTVDPPHNLRCSRHCCCMKTACPLYLPPQLLQA